MQDYYDLENSEELDKKHEDSAEWHACYTGLYEPHRQVTKNAFLIGARCGYLNGVRDSISVLNSKEAKSNDDPFEGLDPDEWAKYIASKLGVK